MKLTPRELLHLFQNRENNYVKIMAYTVKSITDISGKSVYLPFD